MIKFKNVTKIFNPDIVAVNNFSLEINQGEFVSIIGRSGAGKTTLVKMLIAEEKPTKGDIYIGDLNVSSIRYREIPSLRRQMGVVFQDYKLLPRKTVFENVAFALEVCGETKQRIYSVVPQILSIVGLNGKLDKFPVHLSGGEKQKVALARALVNRPKILIADEPTGNLDTFNTREIMDLLKKINEFGTTVVLVTHNRDVVNTLRGRVVVVEKGEMASDKESGKYIL
jgi:cell division transport system ATP-binding protein